MLTHSAYVKLCSTGVKLQIWKGYKASLNSSSQDPDRLLKCLRTFSYVIKSFCNIFLYIALFYFILFMLNQTHNQRVHITLESFSYSFTISFIIALSSSGSRQVQLTLQKVENSPSITGQTRTHIQAYLGNLAIMSPLILAASHWTVGGNSHWISIMACIEIYLPNLPGNQTHDLI